MKQTALLLSCLLISLMHFGQSFIPGSDTEFDPGMSFATPDGGFIGIEKKESKSGGLNWNRYRLRISVIRYDKNGQVQKTKQLADGDNVFSAFYSELKKIGDKFWLIYIEPGKKNNIGTVKAVEIDPVTLATSTPKTIATSETIDLSIKFVAGIGDLHIVSESSPGHKYTYLFVGAGRDDFFLTCLDENLNSVWGKKFDLQGLDDEEFETKKIDDAGNIYLGFVKNKKPSVWMYSAKGVERRSALDLGPIVPADMSLLVSPKTKSLIAAGAYWGGTTKFSGIYKATMNLETFAWEQPATNVFTAPLIEQLERDGFASTKPGEFGIDNVLNGKLFEREDGSTGYIAEVRYTYAGERVSYTEAASLLVVNFGPALPFMVRVPKNNKLNGFVMYDQYHFAVCGSKLLLFYRDNPANLTTEMTLKPKPTTDKKNTILVAASIERDGTITRKQIGDAEYCCGYKISEGIRETLQTECKGLP